MQNIIAVTQGQMQFFGTYLIEIDLVILAAIVIVATAIDVRSHRIPNWLVGAGALGGLAFHALSPFGSSALFSLAGMAIGMAAFLPLYAIGAMGAGDVKLMGMVGAFLGTTSVLGAVLATFIAGGVLALGAAVHKRLIPQLLSNVCMLVLHRNTGAISLKSSTSGEKNLSVGEMPYALAIAAGTAVQIYFVRG